MVPRDQLRQSLQPSEIEAHKYNFCKQKLIFLLIYLRDTLVSFLHLAIL